MVEMQKVWGKVLLKSRKVKLSTPFAAEGGRRTIACSGSISRSSFRRNQRYKQSKARSASKSKVTNVMTPPRSQSWFLLVTVLKARTNPKALKARQTNNAFRILRDSRI